MRLFNLIVPLISLAGVAYGLPSTSPLAGRSLAPRGVGTLGEGAFAGSGADASRITALQLLLGVRGHAVAVDGVWGSETSGAVSAFQSGAGLDADGIPGPATLGALVDQIQQGDGGGIVSAAQTTLKTHGGPADLAVDGDFGPGTHAAAVALQGAYGLAQDGIIGHNSWTALFNEPLAAPPPPPPTPEDPKKPVPNAVTAGQARLLSDPEIIDLERKARYAASTAPAGTARLYRRVGGTWWNNLWILQKTPTEEHFPGSTGVRLHSGFYDDFVAMIKPIHAAVAKARVDGNTRILVVGHSQGGAVSTLMAASLQATFSDMTVFGASFSAPRQGNTKWADYVDRVLKDRAPHVINYNDAVPNLPMREGKLFGQTFEYTHPSHEVWITKEQQWIACNGRENTYCANSTMPKSFGPHGGPFGTVKGMGGCEASRGIARPSG
ncbi:putative feruloyl esterase A [Vanrija pseudolonga]|uniref:Feruloyl esterase A n=1 Tax=Vanrija pseudolonga TaxID=143232 RepID=A0AAF0Y615_9TREE|nr:putative feruloyl esterase A [Vanrija pseudolonga]